MLVVEQRFCGLRKSDKFGGTWIPFSVNNLRLAMCSFARVTSVIRRGPARNNANAVPNWVASQRCKPTVQKSGLLTRLSLALAFVFPLLTLFVQILAFQLNCTTLNTLLHCLSSQELPVGPRLSFSNMQLTMPQYMKSVLSRLTWSQAVNVIFVFTTIKQLTVFYCVREFVISQ